MSNLNIKIIDGMYVLTAITAVEKLGQMETLELHINDQITQSVITEECTLGLTLRYIKTFYPGERIKIKHFRHINNSKSLIQEHLYVQKPIYLGD